MDNLIEMDDMSAEIDDVDFNKIVVKRPTDQDDEEDNIDQDTDYLKFKPKTRDMKRNRRQIGMPYDSKNINNPTNILLLAPTQSGKTELIKTMVRQMHDQFHDIYFFGKNSSEEIWLPRSHRFSSIDKEKIQKLRGKGKKYKAAGLRMLFIFDDILGENFHRDKFWDDFISTVRHEGISVIFSIQYCKSIPPCMKDNIKLIYILHTNKDTSTAIHGITSGEMKQQAFCSFLEQNCWRDKTAKKISFVQIDRNPKDISSNEKEFTVYEFGLCRPFKLEHAVEE